MAASPIGENVCQPWGSNPRPQDYCQNMSYATTKKKDTKARKRDIMPSPETGPKKLMVLKHTKSLNFLLVCSWFSVFQAKISLLCSETQGGEFKSRKNPYNTEPWPVPQPSWNHLLTTDNQHNLRGAAV
jgi:hypothetical protein